MKYKILLLVAMVSIFGCKEETKIDKRRYFFVAFHAGDKNIGYHAGNFTTVSDTLPSKEYYHHLIYNYVKCEGYSESEIIITGVSEFRDSIDFKKWINPIGGKMDTCYISQPLIIFSDTISFGGTLMSDTVVSGNLKRVTPKN